MREKIKCLTCPREKEIETNPYYTRFEDDEGWTRFFIRDNRYDIPKGWTEIHLRESADVSSIMSITLCKNCKESIFYELNYLNNKGLIEEIYK